MGQHIKTRSTIDQTVNKLVGKNVNYNKTCRDDDFNSSPFATKSGEAFFVDCLNQVLIKDPKQPMMESKL